MAHAKCLTCCPGLICREVRGMSWRKLLFLRFRSHLPRESATMTGVWNARSEESGQPPLWWALCRDLCSADGVGPGI